MEKRIKNILSSIFGVRASKINQNTSTDTLGEWDSLRHMCLITALEKEFALHFTGKEIIEMTSFSRIKNIIKKKNKKRP